MAFGPESTTNLAASAAINVRVKSILRTGWHASNTRRPRYDGHDTASSLGATRIAGGCSGIGGSLADGVVVALGGISEGFGSDGTAADGSDGREADGRPA